MPGGIYLLTLALHSPHHLLPKLALSTPLKALPRTRARTLRLASADEPDADVVELLSLFRSLPLDAHEAVEALPLEQQRSAAEQLRAPSTASELSLSAITSASKSILASNEPALRKQDAIAELSHRARESGRAASAQLAFDLAYRRLRKWSTTKRTPISRPLLLAGLLAAVASRDRAAYEALLLAAQEQWGVELAEEPTLLSGALAGCSDAGWSEHARACNLTLVGAGLSPTTGALNAMLAASLRAGDEDGVLDGFIHLRTLGPPPDRASQALATRAAVRRKASWSGLRNLMRRSWLKIPWNADTANAAVGGFVAAGNLRAAAGVVGQMQSTRTPLRLQSLERLLCLREGRTFHGLPWPSMAFHWPSTAFHCSSTAFHGRPPTFHCPSTGLSTAFHWPSMAFH